MILASLIACLLVFGALGIRYGEDSAISRSLPVTFLTIVRAAVAEELFYRGYAFERIEALAGSKWIAAAVTLTLFAGFHYRQGLAGMTLVLVVGAILTGFYMWKRDLMAAVAAHFLVDFIPNILFPLLAADPT